MTHQHVSSDKLFRLSLEVLPKVNILGIQSNKDHGKTDFSIRKLKRMIAAASENLHSLTIAIPKFRANMCNTGASTIPPTPVITARPKRLIIRAFGDKDQVVEDWSWLWGACGQLKEIELCYVANSIIESLAKAIRNWMPRLDSVSFSDARPYWTLDYIPDSNIASILAAGTKGWKVVQCHYEAEVGSQTFDALLQHFETLEQFVVSRADDSTGIMRVLKSCPHLRVLETIGSENDDHRPLSIHATDFIDRDPASGTYRPWPCTRTLETLTITIVDIPVHYPSLIDEDDEQRTLEIQRRVCERLGQFTNLKILRLGHLRYGLDGIICPSMFLALTLDTGMEKLGGLDKLQELYINYNHHLIDGELEVKWMAENWRKLWKVRGLRRHTAAYKWINKSIHQINLLSKELFRLALEIFPNVNTLSIQGEGGDCRMALSIPKFQQIMAAASDKLPLTIAIQGSEQSNGNIAALSFAPAPVIEARPKHLRIRGFGAEDQVVED
ncbi:hypothetical protein CPB97_006764 [Podila verticillata]|nr:hypothetical protein CPB97_006764 [Podila verticillata]